MISADSSAEAFWVICLDISFRKWRNFNTDKLRLETMDANVTIILMEHPDVIMPRWTFFGWNQ